MDGKHLKSIILTVLLCFIGFLFYFLDGKLTSYRMIDEKHFENYSYDFQKQPSPFEFAYDKPANQLAYEINLSMKFSASAFQEKQTLFATADNGNGISLYVDSDSSLIVEYKAEGKKTAVSLPVVSIQNDRTYLLDLLVSKNGVIKIFIDKELVFKDRVRKFDFSLIKAGKDYNEKLFNGHIDILSFDHKAHKTTYGMQNLTVFLLSVIALFIFIELFDLKKKIILFLKDIYLQTKYASNILMQNLKFLSVSQFYMCAAVVFLYALPMILADIPFSDDYSRITGGGFWNNDSRFLTGIIYKIISFNLSMVNVAPLSLIVGMSFLLISSYMLFCKWAGKNSAAVSLSALSLILSPIILFTLMSYQLDAVGIAFSFVFALGIFLIPDSSNVKFKFFSAFILTFCVMLTHQSSIAVVAILMFTEFIIVINRQNNDYKKALTLFLMRAASSVSSLFVWYIIVGRSSRFGGGAIINENNALFAVFIRIKTFVNYFFSSRLYGTFCLIVFTFIFLFFIFMCSKSAFRLLRVKSLTNIVSAFIIFCAPPALLFLGIVGANITTSFSEYIGLTMLMSFSAFISCMVFMVLHFYGGIIKKVLICAAVIPLLYSFSLSYAYAKFLKYSYETNQVIVSSLLPYMNAGEKAVVFSKTAKELPARIKNILEAFPAIYMVSEITNIQQVRNYFHLAIILKFFGSNAKAYDKDNAYNRAMAADVKNNISQLRLVCAHYYYNLWQYKNMYIIDFTKDKKLSLDEEG
ncbi:MAG: glucosyltransferase domain-containing protein [Endomicrobium sp.]|jgi:hypothetical protein|nr:glucosyltransferase domain-containing protein [Endomicrobium sp.]